MYANALTSTTVDHPCLLLTIKLPNLRYGPYSRAILSGARSLLSSLASTQAHSLAILLQLGDQLVTLAHNVLVLLVFVVWAVGLDDTLA